MRQKRNAYKAVLSFCLAAILALQSVPFTGVFNAMGAEDTQEVSSGKSEESDGLSLATSSEASEPDDFEPATSSQADRSNEAAEPQKPAAGSMALPMAFASVKAEDKTSVFMTANQLPFPLTVTQNKADVPQGGIIQGRQQFTLKSGSLNVPVNGDDPHPTTADPSAYIQKGDWIELKRDDYFKEVILSTSTKTLSAVTEVGTKKLGTAYFTQDSIKIVFDGDDYFFSGVGRGVILNFETTANSDLTGMNFGDTKSISIFGSNYQLKNPEVTPAYAITLTADNAPKDGKWTWWYPNQKAYQDGYLTFRSTASSFDVLDNAIKLNVDGQTFYTKLSDYRMVYKAGSFKVNDTLVDPIIGEDGSLSYTFPTGTGQDPKVEYQAWFDKGLYYREYDSRGYNPGRDNGEKFIPTVKLKEADVSAQQEMWTAPDWIQQSSALDYPNKTIIWTIDVDKNYLKQGLKNFSITDKLPDKLTYVSSEYQLWDSAKGKFSDAVTSILPVNDAYSFGDIDGPVRLVIKSTFTESSGSYTNIARANWDMNTADGEGKLIQNNDVTTGTRPAAVTAEAVMTIGSHGITKSGTASSGIDGKDYDMDIAAITWTVNVTPQYYDPDFAVYDLLRYDNTFDITKVDENDKVTKEVLNTIGSKLYNNTWQQYQKDSFKTANGLNLEVITLTQGGKPVADLLKVTGYTDKPASFTYRSLMTNPSDFAGQYSGGQPYRYNRAYLFSGNAHIISGDTAPQVFSRMLNKEMLAASYPIKSDGKPDTAYIINNVGSYISNDSNEAYTLAAYDRTTKTVTFRLAVNIPGLKTDKMTGPNRVASDIKLVDTLPEGWEFIPYSEGKDYELYEGLRNLFDYGKQINTVVGVIEHSDPRHVVKFTHSGNVGTFEFSKLESPYVILVKARPTNTALETYLDEFLTNGMGKQVLFNQADLHITWGGTEKVNTERRKVIVPIQSLSKSVTKPSPGVLEWTVNYTPPINLGKNVYLQDTLGAGTKLRRDVNGSLILTAPSMAVYRAKLTAGGTLERVGEALDLSSPNCEVQVTAESGAGGTTVLKFVMNDPNQIYQLVYQTEVDTSTVKAGDKIGNEVKLMGDDSLKSIGAKSESTIDAADIAGSSSSNAQLPLKKVDPNGIPLSGVEFTLYKKDSGTEAAKGTTGADGKLNLLFPDPGYYELKETYIDLNTWLPTSRIYQVYVGNTPGKPIWVDGVRVTADSPLIVPTPATGKLTIGNTVQGKDGEKGKSFEYTIDFSGEGKDDSYVYTKSDGTSGKIKSGDKISLKDGETIVLPRLLEKLIYTVTENDYTAQDYITDPTGRTYGGTIVKDGNQEARFLNTRNLEGSLCIEEAVEGNGSDENKTFNFIVTFDGPGKDGTYTYSKTDGTNGTIKSGDLVQLKHGQSITIAGIPKDTVYTVAQDDYSGDGYNTNPEGCKQTGTIENKEISKMPFINARYLPGTLTLAPDPELVPGDGKTQSKLTATLIGEDGKPVVNAEIIFDLGNGREEKGITDAQGKAVIYYVPEMVTGTIPEEHLIKARTVSKTGVLKETEAKVTAMPAALTGILRDNTTDEVIPNAKVNVKNMETGQIQTITTDENGAYFLPVSRDQKYTVSFVQMVDVSGVKTPITFTQNAKIDSDVSEGEIVPAEITAVGVVLLKEPDGQRSLLTDAFSSKLKVYLRDDGGKYISDSSGSPKAFEMQENGTFSVLGLKKGSNYTMEVRYEVNPGVELTLKTAELNVKANGELNISQELIDPYGIVTDANTNKLIQGAEVTLYYADTQRNKDNGITPGTKVILPEIPGFAPNDNTSPSQKSDVNGAYAYMVFPNRDYYVVVTKEGYATYTSKTISVETEIVRCDVPMIPQGNGNSDSGSLNSGSSGSQSSGSGSSRGVIRSTGVIDNRIGPGVSSSSAAPVVTVDDVHDTLKNMDSTMEYSIDGGDWISYDPASILNLSGNHTVQIRVKADGSVPAGDITTVYFTSGGNDLGAVPGNSGSAGKGRDNLPKTGDDGTSKHVNMAALFSLVSMCLMALSISLSKRKKKEDIY